MNCFYRMFYRSALLVFLLGFFGLQYAEACITPKPVIEGNDTVCENSVEVYKLEPSPDSYKYKIKVIVGNGNATDLNWYNYIEIKWTRPGAAFVRFIYTDKSGCTDSVTKQILVKPSDFRFDAGPDIYACQYDIVILGLPPIKNLVYRWHDLRQHYIGQPPVSNSSTHKVQVLGIVNRIFTFYYKVSAKDTVTGCSYVDTVALSIYPRTKTIITGETGCINDSATYQYSTDSMPVNATWEIDGGEFLSNNLAKSVLVKWNRIGKNKLILKYFTGDCKDSTVIETVLSAVKQPFFAGPDVVACHGDSVILGMPPIPNCRYEWLDLRYIAFEQWEFESYIKKRFYSQSKKTDLVIIYKVFLTDTISGCKFVDTVKLIVKPRLKTNITATVGCYREIASFSTDTLPADAYWFAEGGEIITDNKAKSIFVKWSRNGTNIIKLRYNFNGCTDSAVYMADIDSLTHFPIIGADSIFENTFHTYTVEKLGKTENKWRVTGGEIISETENAITIQWGNTNADANIWTYKINDKGCFSDTSLLPVTIKKRENLDLSHTFHVYPNPFSNNIMIAPVNDFSGEIRIVLSDMLGRKMLEQTAYMQSGKNALNLNVSAAGLKSGFYNINIIYPQGKSTWKLVRE